MLLLAPLTEGNTLLSDPILHDLHLARRIRSQTQPCVN